MPVPRALLDEINEWVPRPARRNTSERTEEEDHAALEVSDGEARWRLMTLGCPARSSRYRKAFCGVFPVQEFAEIHLRAPTWKGAESQFEKCVFYN